MNNKMRCIVLIVLASCLVSVVLGFNVGYVGGKGIRPEVNAGEVYDQVIIVKLGENEPPSDISMEVLGWKDSLDGAPVPVSASEDVGPYSARTYFSPENMTLHLDSGESTQFDLKITVPSGTGAGGRYAILRFTAVPPDGGMVRVSQEIVLPMRFTILGGDLHHTGSIEAVRADDVESNKAIDIISLVKNTGNHHFSLRNDIVISDRNGTTIDQIEVNRTSPIAGSSKNIHVQYYPKSPLALGTYTISSRVSLEDGTLLDEKTATFEVKEPYIPPPPPVNATISPSDGGTLATTDGRLSIAFPKGAVLSASTVSLESVPSDKVPKAPEGCALTTTCFRVSGLSGLLAKDATVTAQYCDADLSCANGDAGKLALARYDEVENAWVVQKTGVDAGAKTLTAATNRMGLWAVMATSGTVPGASQQSAPVAVLPLAALAALVILMRRHGRG
jgi:hypothetical protein